MIPTKKLRDVLDACDITGISAHQIQCMNDRELGLFLSQLASFRSSSKRQAILNFHAAHLLANGIYIPGLKEERTHLAKRFTLVLEPLGEFIGHANERWRTYSNKEKKSFLTTIVDTIESEVGTGPFSIHLSEKTDPSDKDLTTLGNYSLGTLTLFPEAYRSSTEAVRIVGHEYGHHAQSSKPKHRQVTLLSRWHHIIDPIPNHSSETLKTEFGISDYDAFNSYTNQVSEGNANFFGDSILNACEHAQGNHLNKTRFEEALSKFIPRIQTACAIPILFRGPPSNPQKKAASQAPRSKSRS